MLLLIPPLISVKHVSKRGPKNTCLRTQSKITHGDRVQPHLGRYKYMAHAAEPTLNDNVSLWKVTSTVTVMLKLRSYIAIL